jgi:oligopeptide/dipeptide ABC transporter ATP-binding protein
MPLLLDIRNLRTWFPIRRGVLARTVGYVRAVDGVTLWVDEGETLGLVGESGCGKTTVARSVLGLDPVRSGEIAFAGVPLTGPGVKIGPETRRRMQVVFQDPFASLNPRMTAGDIVTEGVLEHGMIRRRERQAAAAGLLAEVGLGADALSRFPHEFSGGQRQRISLARAVATRPALVVCDEAVSALDVSVQAQMLNLLLDLKASHRLAYVFISHDINVVRHVSDRVAVMYLGQIVETGPCGAVIGSPAHPYTRALMAAIPRVGSARERRMGLQGDVPSPANPPSGCRFHPRCPHAGADCARVEPSLEPFAADVGGARRVACLRQGEI